MKVTCFIVAEEAESGAAVLFIGEPWVPGVGSTPAPTCPAVDTALLMDAAPPTEAGVTWSE
jgi:hypothetical protein